MTMWVAMLMVVLAVNAGLFAGALLFSAFEAARTAQLTDMAAKIWRAQKS